jgi:hypothetical protein
MVFLSSAHTFRVRIAASIATKSFRSTYSSFLGCITNSGGDRRDEIGRRKTKTAKERAR